MKGIFLGLLFLNCSLSAVEISPVVLPKTQVSVHKAKNYYNLLGMKGFSDQLLTQHFKLYEGYVAQVNSIQEKIGMLLDANLSKSSEYAGLKKALAFEYDGMRLHELYFENLGGKGPLNLQSQLYKKIIADFGSYEKWKADFIATGLLRGIGWAILYFDPNDNRLINAWVESHEKGHLANCDIILVMDVWEHAYITEYGIQRGDYIDAFMSNIQWNIASNRFDLANR